MNSPLPLLLSRAQILSTSKSLHHNVTKNQSIRTRISTVNRSPHFQAHLRSLHSSRRVAMASADNKTPEGKVVSEVAQEEGGPTKGSDAAKMQSQITKEKNAEQIDQHLAEKMAAGEPISKEEARLAESRESRAMGGSRPPPGSIASQAQSAADKENNAEQIDAKIARKLADGAPIYKEEARLAESREARATDGTRPLPGSVASQAQSAADREANFEQVAQEIGRKMQNDPSSITKEDAAYLHSREARAVGGDSVPKDSIAADAQRMASANEQAKETKGDN